VRWQRLDPSTDEAEHLGDPGELLDAGWPLQARLHRPGRQPTRRWRFLAGMGRRTETSQE